MKITLNLTKILIVMAALLAMAFITTIAAHAHTPHVTEHPAELAGNGPHLVIDGGNRVVGVVMDGAIVAVNPDIAKSDPRTNVPTLRLQTQRIPTQQKNWNPEPAGCPRGVKVMRYGTWGC